MTTPTNNSIIKAFDVIQTVFSFPHAPALREIAERVELPIATTHRIIATLKRAGAIRTMPDGSYAIGRQLIALGNSSACDLYRLNIIIEACLNRLSEEFGAKTHISILDQENMIFYIAASPAVESNTNSRQAGGSYEAYCSAAGKLMLAELPQKELLGYMNGLPLVAMTRHTITDPKQLYAELKRVRQAGYAAEEEEFGEGVTALAVPILGNAKKIVAALSVEQRQSSGGQRVCEAVSRLNRVAATLSKAFAKLPRGENAFLCGDAVSGSSLATEPGRQYGFA